jgi:hypothetical protein
MGIIHKKQGQALRLVPVFLLFISVNDFIYRRLGHFVKPLGLPETHTTKVVWFLSLQTSLILSFILNIFYNI